MSTELNKDLHLEIGHVLFIDLVGYSKLLIEEQKERLRQLTDTVLATTQVRAATNERLVKLPTGDGMALVFRNSVEEPVRCALEIAQALQQYPKIAVRMGVHSGPVSEVTDVSGRTNMAGAGINMAQRVMDCGDAGHILVSRHVAEDLEYYARWHPCLHDLGEFEVKHGVKVGVVNLYNEEIGNSQPPRKLAQRASRVTDKSIAVLPFENLSADPENAFFVDGVHDEILTDLARIADLKVISRTSVMQYKTGTKRNLREIASELGVAHIVEGSVQRAGNRIRLRAQLIDARTDVHLWADKFDRPLDDVFAIQSDIAKTIADQLEAKLLPAEKSVIELPPTTDLLAYDRYLRGKGAFAQIMYARSEDFRQAIRLLEQAVAYDPAFYLAYCQLARTHEYLYYWGADHTPARVAQARQALDKALALAPERGEAHVAAAAIAYHCERDYKTALAELAIAQRSLPNDSSIFEFTSFIARRQGHWTQCIENAGRAADLDPRNESLLQVFSSTYLLLRRYSDAARMLDRAIAISPRSAPSRVARALIDLDERADTQPGHDAIHAAVTENPNAAEAIADQWFYLALCRRDSSEIARAVASMSPEGIVPVNVRMPRNYCEGLAARAKGDASSAEAAFTKTCEEMEQMVRDQPNYAEALSILGMSEAALGRKEDALRHSRRSVELFPVAKDAVAGSEIVRNLAITYAWAGEKELAIAQLQEVVGIPVPVFYGQLRLHPWWDPLRDDPRFEQLMAEAQKPVALKNLG